jgi:hypothetical protein
MPKGCWSSATRGATSRSGTAAARLPAAVGRRPDVRREQVHDGRILLGEDRIVCRQHTGGVQEIAVVEVVVVELLRAERRRQADDTLGMLVVDEAERLALGATLRVCPLIERLGQLGFEVGGRLFGV